jgi:hypothetical protein
MAEDQSQLDQFREDLLSAQRLLVYIERERERERAREIERERLSC